MLDSVSSSSSRLHARSAAHMASGRGATSATRPLGDRERCPRTVSTLRSRTLRLARADDEKGRRLSLQIVE
jgi:hypothetical protein